MFATHQHSTVINRTKLFPNQPRQDKVIDQTRTQQQHVNSENTQHSTIHCDLELQVSRMILAYNTLSCYGQS